MSDHDLVLASLFLGIANSAAIGAGVLVRRSREKVRERLDQRPIIEMVEREMGRRLVSLLREGQASVGSGTSVEPGPPPSWDEAVARFEAICLQASEAAIEAARWFPDLEPSRRTDIEELRAALGRPLMVGPRG